MPIADFALGDALLTVLSIFFLFAWIYLLITIFGDLFADQETSGWGKAIWVLALLVLPFLGVLIYLIARGDGMRQRTIANAEQRRDEMNAYIRDTAGGGSPADELHKLSELKDKGAISAEEFERAKAKLLS